MAAIYVFTNDSPRIFHDHINISMEFITWSGVSWLLDEDFKSFMDSHITTVGNLIELIEKERKGFWNPNSKWVKKCEIKAKKHVLPFLKSLNLNYIIEIDEDCHRKF